MRKGSILIAVIALLATVTIIAVSTFEKSETTTFLSLDIPADNQASLYVISAIEAFKELVNNGNDYYDSKSDIWMNIPPIKVAKGSVSIRVTTLEDKIPINAMSDISSSGVSTRVYDALFRFFEDKNEDVNLINNIYDWITPSSEASKGYQVKGNTFNNDGNSYTPSYNRLITLSEIKLIPEVADKYEFISTFATTGMLHNKININTASKDVISYYLPELEPYMDEIIRKRDGEPFKRVDAIFPIVGQEVYLKVLPYIDVASKYVYMKIIVTLSTGDKYFHVLLKKEGKRVTPELYIEGGSIDYF